MASNVITTGTNAIKGHHVAGFYISDEAAAKAAAMTDAEWVEIARAEVAEHAADVEKYTAEGDAASAADAAEMLADAKLELSSLLEK